jgi:hypothetical protein
MKKEFKMNQINIRLYGVNQLKMKKNSIELRLVLSIPYFINNQIKQNILK